MSDFDKDILEVKKLRRRDYRLKTGLTIAEGYPEVTRAIKAGVVIEKLYVCPEIIQTKNGKFDGQPVVEITEEEFAHIAFGGRIKGILAICRPKQYTLNEIQLSDNPLIIVVESVEKPGNLGTIIRSADGAGVDAVVMCDARTDVYNHNIVRSSIGTVFHVPSVSATNEETLDFLKSHKIKSFAASGKAKDDYTRADLSGPAAIIVGTEHEGLSSFWLEQTDRTIKIPMQGESRSLNAAISASILMYEAVRQRR